MIRVLLVAAESVPFAKTGGLADVVGSLPKELRKLGIDARVIMPKYGDIPASFKEQFSPVGTITVPVGWRKQYCGIETLEYDGIPFYFVDNEYYFKRNGLYGYFDDAERFGYFSRAVLDALPLIGFQPDVLHCHDWHTAMVLPLLGACFRHDPFYQAMRTAFTIHNLKYQGIFPPEVLGELFGLGDEYFTADTLEFHGGVNYMKGGLVFADAITTVSRTYAEEIQTAHYGEQLDGLLRLRQKDLHGIVNGIDYDAYNPSFDPALFVHYTWRSPKRKLQNKKKLQELLGLPVAESTPLIAIISRLVQPKGLDLVTRVLDDILALDAQLVVLGTGEEKYEGMFRIASHQHPDKVSANIFFDDVLASRLYAASDLFLMPSQFEPCGIGQLVAMRYGSLPVVRETGGLLDTVVSYNEATGEGNGFSFANYNAHDMLYTINRALDFYRQPELWTKIVQNAMKQDYSWKQSAVRYQELYAALTAEN